MSCWPWAHKWSKWEIQEVGYRTSTVDGLSLPIANPADRPIIGKFERQRRECSICGKSQLRKVCA